MIHIKHYTDFICENNNINKKKLVDAFFKFLEKQAYSPNTAEIGKFKLSQLKQKRIQIYSKITNAIQKLKRGDSIKESANIFDKLLKRISDIDDEFNKFLELMVSFRSHVYHYIDRFTTEEKYTAFRRDLDLAYEFNANDKNALISAIIDLRDEFDDQLVNEFDRILKSVIPNTDFLYNIDIDMQYVKGAFVYKNNTPKVMLFINSLLDNEKSFVSLIFGDDAQFHKTLQHISQIFAHEITHKYDYLSSDGYMSNTTNVLDSNFETDDDVFREYLKNKHELLAYANELVYDVGVIHKKGYNGILTALQNPKIYSTKYDALDKYYNNFFGTNVYDTFDSTVRSLSKQLLDNGRLKLK